MKKLFSLLCVIAMLAGLVACGEAADEEKEQDLTNEETQEDNGLFDESDEIDKSEETDNAVNEEETIPEETQDPENLDKPAEPVTGTESEDIGQEEPPANSVDPVYPTVEPESPADSSEPDDIMSLSEIMAQLNQYDEEMPVLMDAPLSAEEYSGNLFINYIEGSEALMSSPMIGSIAHCVVLLRLPEGSDVSGVAEQIKVNANPRKWICVEAEAVEVRTSGNIVMLVMSSQTAVDKVVSNFELLSL